MAAKVIFTSFPRGSADLREPVPVPPGAARMAAGHVADRHRMLAVLDDPWRQRDTLWDVRVTNGSYCVDPAMRSLQVQVLCRKYVGDAEVSLWVDPDVEFRDDLDLDVLAAAHLAGADVCAFRHPAHDCSYDYAEELCARFPLHAPAIREQVDRYRREGMPSHRGLLDPSVLLRRHTQSVDDACSLWWRELIMGYPDRTLAFNYALWCAGSLRANVFPGHLGRDFTPEVVEPPRLVASNPYFRRRP